PRVAGSLFGPATRPACWQAAGRPGPGRRSTGDGETRQDVFQRLGLLDLRDMPATVDDGGADAGGVAEAVAQGGQGRPVDDAVVVAPDAQHRHGKFREAV